MDDFERPSYVEELYQQKKAALLRLGLTETSLVLHDFGSRQAIAEKILAEDACLSMTMTAEDLDSYLREAPFPILEE